MPQIENIATRKCDKIMPYKIFLASKPSQQEGRVCLWKRIKKAKKTGRVVHAP
jgi:hypothetical protein